MVRYYFRVVIAKEKTEKIQASTGFEPLRYGCSALPLELLSVGSRSIFVGPSMPLNFEHQ